MRALFFKETFGQTDYLFAQYRLQMREMSVVFSRTRLAWSAMADSAIPSQYIYIASIL